ncbi:MAG: 4Fe-4S binding protein [Desulfotomaculaceae bacterium]
MATEMIIKPERCIGCSTCVLTCSLVHYGVFDPARASIRVDRDDFAGVFELCFSSTCNGCKQCARVCPSGALQLVEIEVTK